MYRPILAAMNAEVPGAAVLFNVMNSFLRSNIPPGENRVPFILTRIGWFFMGRLDKLEATSQRPQARRELDGTATGIHSHHAAIAGRAEANLGRGSLRSAKRVIND